MHNRCCFHAYLYLAITFSIFKNCVFWNIPNSNQPSPPCKFKNKSKKFAHTWHWRTREGMFEGLKLPPSNVENRISIPLSYQKVWVKRCCPFQQMGLGRLCLGPVLDIKCGIRWKRKEIETLTYTDYSKQIQVRMVTFSHHSNLFMSTYACVCKLLIWVTWVVSTVIIWFSGKIATNIKNVTRVYKLMSTTAFVLNGCNNLISHSFWLINPFAPNLP